MVVRLKDLDERNNATKSGLVRLKDLEPVAEKPVSAPPPLNPANSRWMQNVSSAPAEAAEAKEDERNVVQRALDYVLKENPVARVVNYPFAKAAEMSIPDAPMIGQREDGSYGNLPGPTARESHAEAFPVPSTGNETVDKVLGAAGTAGSYFLNPAAPAQGPVALYRAATDLAASRTANRLADAVTSRLPNAGLALSRDGTRIVDSLASQAVREGAKEAAVGAAYAVPRSLLQGESSAEEIAQNVALEGAIGAGSGALAAAGGAAIRALRRPRTPEISQEVFQQVADALPVRSRIGDTFQPTQVRRGGTRDAVIDQIRDEVTARMTPPLENPDELARWLRPYLGGEDISLNEIRQLPYEDLRQLAEEVRGGLNMYDVAVQVAREKGTNLPRLLSPTPLRSIAPGALQRGRETLRLREVAGLPLLRRRADDYAAIFGPQALRNVDRRPEVATVQPTPPAPASSATLPARTAIRSPAPAVPEGAERAIPSEPTGLRERGFATTLRESEKPPEAFKDRLNAMYRPITNEETLARANRRIEADPEQAASYVMGKSFYTAEKAATAQRLIDHFNTQGNYQRAVDIAQKAAEEATRAGQAIQALSMYDRLTPEGALIYAQRIAAKANESLPVWRKEVMVTPEMAQQIQGLTAATQKMTGVQELAGNVLEILERARSGGQLSEADTTALRRFVREAKQFVDETKPKQTPSVKPPTIPKEPRIRDRMITFLDAQEQSAKERLRARGIQLSSTPLDVWADYAIIGAAKMARGTIQFTDWSEQMVRELGEQVRPQLQQLYARSKDAFQSSEKTVTRAKLDQAQRLTEKMIRDKSLPDAETATLRQLADQVAGLSGDAKIMASQDLQKVLQALDRPTYLRRVATAQTIGHLLNPKTQVRNALGNELFYRVERLNKLLATPIDIARSKLTGRDRTVTFRTNNQGQFWRNWLRGAKAGWQGVNVQGLETQYDLTAPAFRGKYNPMTYLEKALGASLRSFDVAAYMRAYNNTLGELATLKAINEGKSGDRDLIRSYIRNADENMKAIADEYGRYVTFQDNNALSMGLLRAKRALNFGKDFGFGDLVLKYPKTPGSLLMRALEYSPAGFIRSASIAARPWFKQEPDLAEATQALSRAIIGTGGLTGFGYFLMDKGILTGDASKDRDVRELQQSAGQGQYQVNLSALQRFVQSGFDPDAAAIRPNDMLYTYDWAQPVSLAISIGANIQDQEDEPDETAVSRAKELAGTAASSLASGVNTLTEQSVLQGLRRAAEGYPGQTVTDKIVDVLSEIPASFVPTFSNQLRQITDNARRETYDPDKLQQSLNRAANRVPFLAEQQLPQQSDTLGRPKEVYQDNNLFNVMFNPGFVSRYRLTPEAELIVGLINETGDEGLAPRAPAKTITINGQSVKLSNEEYARLQQYQGEATRRRLERINPNASTRAQSKRVSEILTEAGQEARRRLTRETQEGR